MLGWLCVLQSLVAYTTRHPCLGKYGDWRPCDLPWGLSQSKDALVACQKFCTMQNQKSKQH
ncbi:MAG: hypothetical protein BHW21_02215 [Eubacterium sp. 45_250]|nr:MAG: hypothetical protein BHW21_02215 [Eubacterium sp. 45_250]